MNLFSIAFREVTVPHSRRGSMPNVFNAHVKASSDCFHCTNNTTLSDIFSKLTTNFEISNSLVPIDGMKSEDRWTIS